MIFSLSGTNTLLKHILSIFITWHHLLVFFVCLFCFDFCLFVLFCFGQQFPSTFFTLTGYSTEPSNSSATTLDNRPCYAFTVGLGLIPWNHIADSGKWNDSEEYSISGEGKRLGNQGVAKHNLNIQRKVNITNRTRPWKRLRVRESAVHVEVSPLIE